MTASSNRDALHNLADALGEDVVHMPAKRLLAEAARDYGDARALVMAFDRIAARATRQARWRRIAGRLAEIVAPRHAVRSWRLPMACAAAVFVVVIAGSLYVQERNNPASIAGAPSAPTPDTVSRMRPQSFEERLAMREEGPAAGASVAGASRALTAPAAAPPSAGADALNQPRRVRTIGVNPSAPPAPGGQPGGVQRQTAAKSDDTPRAVTAFAPSSGQVESRIRPLAGPTEAEAARLATMSAEAGRSLVASASTSAPSFNWPARGRLISGFGEASGDVRNNGINFALPPGTDVVAAQDGVVVYAGSELKSYGNLVMVRHDGGFVTAYAHASTLLVKPGDKVRRGQPIAKSGRTGNVSEPQVHFEIRNGATPLDPAQYLPKG